MSNQKGITLLLSLFILTAILSVGLFIINLVLRQGKVSQDVGFSEIAFYVAETGMEKALYEINKNKQVDIHYLNNPNYYSEAEGSLPINKSHWKVIESKESFINPFDDSEITNSKPLKINLKTVESFQLSFSFNGLLLPNQIEFKRTSGIPEDSGKIICLKWLKTESPEQGETSIERTPKIIDFDSNYYYKFRLINTDSITVSYTIKPIGGNEKLPMAIETLVSGTYRGLHRQVNTDLPTWQIY